MKLFEDMIQAAQTGTREEFVASNREWYVDAVKDQAAGECRDCLEKKPLHRWLGGFDLICEDCDEIRRKDYDDWDDERAHQRMHAAGRM
jgi:hypothetical protein